MAGRFSRRVRGWAKADGVPVIDCKAGERKHLIAEEYLRRTRVGPGVFLVLVARAPATVWEVQRSKRGVICNLAKKKAFVNHYSFHIMDPSLGARDDQDVGPSALRRPGDLERPRVRRLLRPAAGIAFAKEGNCFTAVADPAGLAQVADTLSQPETIGRLARSATGGSTRACLCFGLDLADQRAVPVPLQLLPVYQVEYSRNLLFRSGAQMDEVFDADRRPHPHAPRRA